MRSFIRSTGLFITSVAAVVVLILAAPQAATAQSGICSECVSVRLCDTQSDRGGTSCGNQDGGCSQGDNICACGSGGCGIIGGPIIGHFDLQPSQLAPEHRHALLAAIESFNFVRVTNGRLAAWDCSGELAYVLEAREDGMLAPADVREWRGRLSTKEVAEDGRVIVRVL